ncbi:MAG: S41 family peptidase [bacterium]|nr:S41 family peptidase [bacterium]
MRKWLMWGCTLLLLSLCGGVAAQEGAPTLQGQALENAAAFTRLMGYVRYFHPSDQAADVNWNQFAVNNIETVTSAADAAELAETLTDIFAPYAPTLRVFAEGDMPPVPSELQTPLRADGLEVVQWVHVPHRSFDEARGGQIEPSTRIRIPLESGDVPQTHLYSDAAKGVNEVTLPVHRPDEPLEVDLGGGVSALVPLALYADENGTLPHVEMPAPIETQSQNLMQRRVRLAAVALAWTHFQHFFLYWDVLEAQGVDWDTALTEALINAAQDTNANDFYDTLARLMNHLRDGHAYVTPPGSVDLPGVSQRTSTHALPFTWDVVEGQLVVTSVFEGAGELQVGDVITAVDGESVETLLARGDALESGVGQFGLYNFLRTLRRGTEGSAAELEIDPVEGEPYTTTIIRVPVIADDEFLYHREPRPPMLAELAPGIVYADLTRVENEDIPRLIAALADAEGIVIDMRGYPTSGAVFALLGYMTDEPLSSAPFLVPVVTTPDPQAVQFSDVSYTLAQPNQPRFTENIAFIINANGTVSAAETFLGVVEAYGLGELVGEPTAGANGTLAELRLPGGYIVSWTSLRVTKHDGSPLFGVGVLPTIPVERTLAGVAAGRDELLEAAFEVVAGGQAFDMAQVQPLEVTVDLAFSLVPYQTDAFSTFVPDGWQENSPATFSPDSGQTVFAITADAAQDGFTSDTIEGMIAELSSQFGTPVESTLSTETLEWRVVVFQPRGAAISVAFALTEVDEAIYAVALLAPADAFDALYSDLFQPALEAFRIVE